jgi:gliding motility-associated transport system permease protein
MIRREIGAYFLSPIAYIVMAIFLFSSGLAFGLGVFGPGEPATLRGLFEFWILLILGFVIPMLTMRLMSEEFRGGTIETLLTAPVKETEIILGKFLGCFVVYLILLATLLIYPIIMSMFGQVDVELLVCNFIGLAFLGALYVAVGLFFSACTKHQIIAVLLSLALLALMTFASQGLATQVETGWLRAVLQQVSIRAHFSDFVLGVIDLNHVVFFLTLTVLFLFLSVKRLEMRRWQ